MNQKLNQKSKNDIFGQLYNLIVLPRNFYKKVSPLPEIANEKVKGFARGELNLIVCRLAVFKNKKFINSIILTKDYVDGHLVITHESITNQQAEMFQELIKAELNFQKELKKNKTN